MTGDEHAPDGSSPFPADVVRTVHAMGFVWGTADGN